MPFHELTDHEVILYARKRRAERVGRKYDGLTVRASPKADAFEPDPMPLNHRQRRNLARSGFARRYGPLTAEAAVPGTRLFNMRVFQRDRCFLCGERFEGIKDISQEHVKPKSRHGHADEHILLAHPACNSRKGDRPPFPCELLYLRAINLRLREEGVTVVARR